ncbi:MAG TPA: hypothetical protein VFA90_18595 [Terriglobales bacterium]|nr:hypothetical protein [Terriglobales bacterium]
MAVHHSTPQFQPLFSQVLDNLVGREIRRVDSILAEAHLMPCEYEDERNPFGCGLVAIVTDLESQRDYCLQHFRSIKADPISQITTSTLTR